MPNTSQHKCNNKNQIIAKALILICIISFGYILYFIAVSLIENDNLNSPTSFHLALEYNLDQYLVHPYDSNNDIDIDLSFLSPNGTIIVGNPVKISGSAFLNTPLAKQKVVSISMVFENSQRYPVIQDSRGVTEETNLYFDKSQKDANRLVLKTTNITWPLEGAYSLKVGMMLIDEAPRVMKFPNVLITVYPKSLYVQILTNRALLLLAIPAFFLTFWSIFSVLISYIRTPTNRVVDNESDKHTTTIDNSNKINKIANETDEMIGGEYPNNTSRKDRDERQKG